MLAMFNNQPIFGPRGPAGPDGNPIGTIINYMGVSAPTDYLICDGTVYNVSDYSKLAEFFKTQFGSSNYFGGDGTTTFAVPDMRNLFLRGFHGTSEEQLSGEVGVRQDGTEIPNISSGYTTGPYLGVYGTSASAGDTVEPKNMDDGKPSHGVSRSTSLVSTWTDTTSYSTYIPRPVNMAVLYCIKATVAKSYEDIYSTEETRIGTWIDGKPLYRRSVQFTTPSSAGYLTIYEGVLDSWKIDTLSNLYGSVRNDTYQARYVINIRSGVDGSAITCGISAGSLEVYVGGTTAFLNQPAVVTLEYTKTTD